MSTINIIQWREAGGGTAWDAHPEAELKERMMRGIIAPKKLIKQTWKQLCDRETAAIDNVREEAVLGITQILQAMGAEIDVDIESRDYAKLLSKWPNR